MADKTTQLILEALGRSAAGPGPLPLFSRPAAPGLFPRTATARLAAQRCLDDGLLRAADKPRESAEITAAGRAFLAKHLHPREILDDCVRALEARQVQLTDLGQTTRHLHDHLNGLKSLVQGALARLAPPGTPTADGAAAILAELERWHEGGAPDDCPLPELFHRLATASSALTLGSFHDALRRLHDAERVYLHPWTGPLYDLPEPAYALLIGHEIAYYASLRREEEAMGRGSSIRGSEDADERGSNQRPGENQRFKQPCL